MASLSKERKSTFRIHWRFKVKLGPRAGEIFEGSLHLGTCTKTAAKAKQREIEEWEERVKTDRFVPDRGADEVFRLWLRERDLTCTPQTLLRSERTMLRYRKWREAEGLDCATNVQLAVREDIIRCSTILVVEDGTPVLHAATPAAFLPSLLATFSRILPWQWKG